MKKKPKACIKWYDRKCKKLMQIVITGGHHSSGLAVVKKLKEKGVNNFLWLGHKYSMWGDKNVSAEYNEVKKAGIPFKELKAGKVYKTYHPLKLLRVPLGFLQAFWYLRQYQPDLIISFGGYLAVPVVLTGWLLRIPSVTHEQTTIVGLANRLIAKFAQKIFISWPQSQKYFDPRKVVLTGLPLREEIFTAKSDQFQFNNQQSVIYVTGGKQGSHIINEAIKLSLPQLLTKVNIIHQCGSSSLHNDFQTLMNLKKSLPTDLQEKYLVKDYYYQEEIGSVFATSGLVVSRAGAHTIYELAALAKPAIFIPIPWVSHNEQYKNARILVNVGMARILPEDQLNTDNLLKEVDYVLSNLPVLSQKALQAKKLIRFDAAEKIANEALKIACV